MVCCFECFDLEVFSYLKVGMIDEMHPFVLVVCCDLRALYFDLCIDFYFAWERYSLYSFTTILSLLFFYFFVT